MVPGGPRLVMRELRGGSGGRIAGEKLGGMMCLDPLFVRESS
jgi:hypothetical protein